HHRQLALWAGERGVCRPAVAPSEVDLVATGSGRANVYAVGYVFRTDAADFAAIVFDASLAPDAYTYLLISEGHGTLAIVTMRRDSGYRERLERAVAALQQAHPFSMEDARRIGGSGTFRLPRTAARAG